MEENKQVHKAGENEHIDDWEPEHWKCLTFRRRVGCGTIYINVNFRKDEPKKVDHVQIFGSSKNIVCNATNIALADMTTFAIRHVRYPSENRAIVKNLKFNKCPYYFPNEFNVFSCADALGKILETQLEIPK